MKFENYKKQLNEWPQEGRHILAQYDDASIVVYQAYSPSIADFAVEHQRFGGNFSYTRMSWIKPNFLWMMYRAGWAAKEGQERILAIRIKREFFDRLLASAVASTFQASGFADNEQWKHAVAKSDVRLQWDPDHDPLGCPVQRRAVQLGLRGAALVEYGSTAIVSITDITDLVRAQHGNAVDNCNELMTPSECVYPVQPAAVANIGVDSWIRHSVRD